MKKFIALVSVCLILLSLASCKDKELPDGQTTTVTQSQTGTGNGGTESEASAATSAPDSSATNGQSAPLDMLNRVWAAYSEDEKFSVSGGDSSEENMTMGGAGNFGITDSAAVDSSLGFPAASIEKIDSAASLMHMMNANTFTCGVYHVKAESDTAALAGEIKENIMNRQWMCGFPDKLVIMTADGCVAAFFGENETVNTFKTKFLSVYSSAETVCDEPIV